MSTMQKKSGLTNMLPAAKSRRRHPGYQPSYSFDELGQRVSAALERAVVRHVAQHFVPALAERRPPRFLCVQGEPNTGKSTSIRIVCSRMGFDLIVVPAATLSGDKEGAPIAELEDLALELIAITTETSGRPIGIMIDDIDLSTAVPAHDNVGVSVNSSLLQSYLQDLSDNRSLLCSAQGVAVPIFITANDLTRARASLFRLNRCEFFTHKVGEAEKLDMIAHLLGVEVSAPLRRLVGDFADEPVGFWAAVKRKAHDEEVDRLLDAHGFDPAMVDAALKAHAWEVNLKTLRRVAEEVAAAEAQNFLKGGKHVAA